MPYQPCIILWLVSFFFSQAFSAVNGAAEAILGADPAVDLGERPSHNPYEAFPDYVYHAGAGFFGGQPATTFSNGKGHHLTARQNAEVGAAALDFAEVGVCVLLVLLHSHVAGLGLGSVIEHFVSFAHRNLF